MKLMSHRPRVFGSLKVALAAVSLALVSSAAAEDGADKPFTLVVMDPLAAPLACDCVQGYAQRKYEKLGEFLEQQLERKVRVVWSQSLEKALAAEAEGRADLVIGKHSVVLSDAGKAKLKVTPIARLTGRDGKTTQTGLIVVPKDDPARAPADLKEYRILFGPSDCDEKSAAPMALLKEQGVAVPAKPETSPACSDAATKCLELGSDVRVAAVISSYAEPLLEGCGTIRKGDLRVIGVSKPVPFVTAFINQTVPALEQAKVIAALNEVQFDVNLLFALETKAGFVPWQGETEGDDNVANAKKKN